MKKEMLPDFSDFFRARAKQKVLLTRTFVAIDESLNLPEIQSLIESLLSQHLITEARFLHEIRNEAIESIGDAGHFSHVGDTGKPDLHDIEVLRLLLSRFNEFRRVVFLTETMKKDPKGIRTLLKNAVQPALVHFHTVLHGDRLVLTVTFKKPETTIENYCKKAEEFVKSHQSEPAYIEILI